jgi:signal peptidase
MEPAIPTGSLVYIKVMEPENVRIGDDIAYYGDRDTNAIITHRVMENRVIMGEFITKGDANRTEDMNPASYDHFIGRVEVAIPQLGVWAQIMTSREGKIAAGCMIGFAVVLHLIATVLERITDVV